MQPSTIQLKIKGNILSGRGVAKSHVIENAAELRRVIGEDAVHGTLNCILKKPVLFSADTAIHFGNEGRMLWPVRLNGISAWAYRWRTAPLHVVEVIASVHLRHTLGLSDGDTVTLSVDVHNLGNISPVGLFAWNICWIGRRHWSYTNDEYYFRTKQWCVTYGATQKGSDKTIKDAMFSLIKNLIKRTPVIGDFAISLKSKIFKNATEPLGHTKKQYEFAREKIQNSDADTFRLVQLKNVLNYTKLSGTSYSADHFPAGYHTIKINGEVWKGQRNPGQRLSVVPVNFEGKSVLDIGCNQGGMLFEIAEVLKWGVGIDYDYRMVNAGNKIRAARNIINLDFFVFNLEKDPLELIKDLIPESRVDVVFLLSVCMWIENWRDVIKFAASLSEGMLFETNGSPNQQKEQLDFLRSVYPHVDLVKEASDDDPGQAKRMLFYCKHSD